MIAVVEQLPLEVQRAFRLISEMESDTNKSLTSLQNALNVYVAAAKDHGAASHVPELQNVVHFLVQSTRNAGDRFSLASTLYETVDRHIQRLDADLTRLLEPQDGLQDDSLQTDDLETVESDEEAESSLTAATHPHSRTIIKIKPSNKSATVSNTFTNHAAASNGTKRKLKKTSASSQKKKRKNAAGDGSYRQPSASLLASLDEIPATPDEPRYCYCNNVAMGDVCCKDLPRKPKLQADGLIPQMVGCDNEGKNVCKPPLRLTEPNCQIVRENGYVSFPLKQDALADRQRIVVPSGVRRHGRGARRGVVLPTVCSSSRRWIAYKGCGRRPDSRSASPAAGCEAEPDEEHSGQW